LVACGGDTFEEVGIFSTLDKAGVVAAQSGEDVAANEDVVGRGEQAIGVTNGSVSVEVFAEDAAGAWADRIDGEAIWKLQRERTADACRAGGVGEFAQVVQPAGESDLVVIEACEPGSGGAFAAEIAGRGNALPGALEHGEGNLRGVLELGQDRGCFVGGEVVDHNDFNANFDGVRRVRGLGDKAFQGAEEQGSAATGREDDAGVYRRLRTLRRLLRLRRWICGGH